jgi:hypothetical protein
VSPFQLRCKVLPPKILERTQSIIHVPDGDTLDQVCIIPDLEDGGVSYERLFGALYDYFEANEFQSIGEYSEFCGIIVVGNRAILNLSDVLR